MNTESEKSPFAQLTSFLSGVSKEKRDIELLTLLGNLVDEMKEIKVTYKRNGKNPELMDFFLNEKYIESSNIQSQSFMDFRAVKIEQGFVLGAAFVIEKVFENIQNSGNESK